MKHIFMFLLFTFVISSDPWLTDFAKAQAEAQNSNKYILLNFSGSDWCAPCIQMKKNIFENQLFLEYASTHLILVRADFPRQKKHQLPAQLKEQNEKLADLYNRDGKFPLTLLLDAQGKVIHQWDGYRDATADIFVTELTSVLHDSQ